MPDLLSRYATPFISGLFLVSLISGIALFFHVGPSGFHGMHEWLSMVLIAPFVLHLWKNWKPLLGYLRRASMAIALAISVIASIPFLYPVSGSGRAGGPPQFALARLVINGSVAEVAPVLDMTAEALMEKLAAAGFTVTGPDQVLTDIAKASGKADADLVAVLVGRGA
ncbi:MAG: DUF4405 domain-containing protein [Rhodobiaceae bacterium]|nr:DUF4405 domain-containing protein [Rhodobiaceae bacterium]MCC0012400.1 DUF4405 domain-containing protein [Rhodobiaceae bacterium]